MGESESRTKDSDSVDKESDNKDKKSTEGEDDDKENKSDSGSVVDLEKEERKEQEKKDAEKKDGENKEEDLTHLGRWEPYYKSTLGKFFLELGLNQAQEFLQADLMRMQKRKLDKM